MKTVQIAIDGPAGAGKSTIAKRIAESFNYVYIDTGAMYRAITLKAMRLNLDFDDPDGFGFIDSTDFAYHEGKLIMDGEDVSDRIRSRDISNNVSLVSSYLSVRKKTVKRQQEIAQNINVVMDGRDIGTNVLVNAQYKFFLTASVQTRARRRYKENLERGIMSTLEDLQREIEMRDQFDSTREHSPLKAASDAIVIDTSNMSIDEVVTIIKRKVREDE